MGMKIYYKQPKDSANSILQRLGIQNCYFKELLPAKDRDVITGKKHYHTSFEFHIVLDGFQEYEVDGINYKVECGSCLLIRPNVPHIVKVSAPNTLKYSLTFNKKTDTGKNVLCETIPQRILENIAFIKKEAANRKEISAFLIENSVLEILVCVLRMLGLKEDSDKGKEDENNILSLAKQYIDDNITFAPSVAEVAAYCYISSAHLTRIFRKYDGLSPGGYIIGKRVEKIESLLADPKISLKHISTAMGFDNEYYFNAFFKKHSGMPPGEYRKMHGQ